MCMAPRMAVKECSTGHAKCGDVVIRRDTRLKS